MAQLQAILKYQEVDAKVYKLERELSSSEERKEYVKIKKFMEAAPEKLNALESKALALKGECESLTAQYERLAESVKDFDNVDELVTEGADISFYQKNVQSILDKLKKVKAEINALVATVKAADEEYKKLKKQVLGVEKQAPAIQAAYKKIKAEKEAAAKPYKVELDALAKEISAEMMELYKTKRKEKIFPVVGQIVGNRCPFCSMDLPIAAMSKLSGGGYIECENHICSRILFE